MSALATLQDAYPDARVHGDDLGAVAHLGRCRSVTLGRSTALGWIAAYHAGDQTVTYGYAGTPARAVAIMAARLPAALALSDVADPDAFRARLEAAGQTLDQNGTLYP